MRAASLLKNVHLGFTSGSHNMAPSSIGRIEDFQSSEHGFDSLWGYKISLKESAMTTNVLTKPEVKTSNPADDFCHIFCVCRPLITLCGAYNKKYPNICGEIGSNVLSKYCQFCGKKVCRLCLEMADKPCPSCLVV